MTAAELMKQLNSDPEYLAIKAKKDAQLQQLHDLREKDESALVAELNKLGLSVSSVWDLVNNAPHEFLERNFIGAYEVAYPLLVKHLTLPHEAMIREGIIRALTVESAKDLAFGALLNELQSETNKSIRWVIANALQEMTSTSERKAYPEIDEAYRAGYL